MRTVRLAMVSHSGADEAFTTISDFEAYPKYVEDITSITVRDMPDAIDGATTYSDWEVTFRNGPLRWTEIDHHMLGERRIVFEQHAGDFEVFRGHWLVEPCPAGARIVFEAQFDFGIPSLAGVLEPIADRVLRHSIFQIAARTLRDVCAVPDEIVTVVDDAYCA